MDQAVDHFSALYALDNLPKYTGINARLLTSAYTSASANTFWNGAGGITVSLTSGLVWSGHEERKKLGCDAFQYQYLGTDHPLRNVNEEPLPYGDILQRGTTIMSVMDTPG
jgi:hypothetical protein